MANRSLLSLLAVMPALVSAVSNPPRIPLAERRLSHVLPSRQLSIAGQARQTSSQTISSGRHYDPHTYTCPERTPGPRRPTMVEVRYAQQPGGFRNAAGTTSTGLAAERDGARHRGGGGRASGGRPLRRPYASARGSSGRHRRGRRIARRCDRRRSRLSRAAEGASLPAVAKRAADAGPRESASGLGAAHRRGCRRRFRRSAAGGAERRSRPDDRPAGRRRGGGGGRQAGPPRPAADR